MEPAAAGTRAERWRRTSGATERAGHSPGQGSCRDIRHPEQHGSAPNTQKLSPLGRLRQVRAAGGDLPSGCTTLPLHLQSACATLFLRKLKQQEGSSLAGNIAPRHSSPPGRPHHALLHVVKQQRVVHVAVAAADVLRGAASLGGKAERAGPKAARLCHSIMHAEIPCPPATNKYTTASPPTQSCPSLPRPGVSRSSTAPRLPSITAARHSGPSALALAWGVVPG